jgi:glucose/mannose transport system substrate-binding protein
VRLDVPTDKLDECNKLVLDSLEKPNFSVENPYYITDNDWMNSVWNTMFTLQGDPSMSTDDVIAMLKSEYDSVFGG